VFFFIKKFEETFDTKLIFILESLIEPKEIFEFIDVPLPACFDLSKPYQSVSSNNSLHVNMFYFFIQFLFLYFSQALFYHVQIQQTHNPNH